MATLLGVLAWRSSSMFVVWYFSAWRSSDIFWLGAALAFFAAALVCLWLGVFRLGAALIFWLGAALVFLRLGAALVCFFFVDCLQNFS